MEIFTKRLNELIKINNLKQKDLAIGIGASEALVSIWKDGKSLPNIIYLKKICDYFNICADYLLGRQDYF